MKPFRFKRFSVEHKVSAMKVGTDAVLLGAWAKLPNLESELIHDVGSGTGLIGLMLAQRYPVAEIKGFELSEDSALEGQRNITNAPFNNTLSVVVGDWMHTGETEQKADLIVSNPPFFESNHPMSDKDRQRARQESAFTIPELIRLAFLRTNSTGSLALVFPYDRLEELSEKAHLVGWKIWRLLEVQRSIDHPIKRVLVQWIKNERAIERNNIALYTGLEWSSDYRALTEAFYL